MWLSMNESTLLLRMAGRFTQLLSGAPRMSRAADFQGHLRLLTSDPDFRSME